MAETKSKVIIGLELDIANAVKNVQGIQGAIGKIALDPAKKDELLRSFGALEKEMLKASSTAAQGFKDSKEMDKFALGVGRLKNEFLSLTDRFKELGIDSKTIEPQTKEFALYSANVDKASKSILDLEEKLTRLSAKEFKGAGADILGSAASSMGAAAKANDKQGIQDIAASSLAEINTKRQEAAALLENITVAEKTYNITTEEGLKDVLKTLDELIEARREYWRLTRGSDTTFATLPPEQQARLAPVQNLSIESMQTQQTELRSNYKAYAHLGEAGIDVSKMEQTFTKLTADIEKQNAALSKNIKLKAAALGGAQASTDQGLEEFSKGATGAGLSLDQGLGTTQQEAQRTKQLEQTAAAYGKIGDNIKRLTGFHAVFSFLKNVIRDVWQDVQQLDKQFNEIAVVTDYTTSEMWDSFSKVNSIAQEYGVTTSNVISVQKLYYQQGKSTIEVNQLTGETLTLAKIAGLDYADATDKMTAALNAYNLEATSATMITDTLSALAAQSAADTAEIANALTRTASIAANAGMGLQETTVWLTKMISTTREPAENLGTALKTIIARFSEIKDLSDEDLVLLGADFDFNRVEKALRSVRISLKDTTGQVRDVDDVFMDLSKVWDTLDRNTQRYIATNAAGSRQQSRFIAMISDYKETLRLTEVAQNSAGTGALQLATTMEGLETSINNLKSAWQELYSNFMDSEVFQTVLGFATQLVLAVSDAAPALAVVIGLLTTLKGLLLVSNTILLVRNLLIKQGTKATLLQVLGFKAKAASQTGEIVIEQMVAGSIVKTTISRKLDSAATMGQVTAETILKGIQTWGIALAVIAAITITALAMSKRAEANATTDQAEAAGTYNKSLAETTKKTNELTEVTQKFYRYRLLNLRLDRLTNEELEEYNDLISFLSKNLEGSIESYDAEGNAILKNNDALQEAIKAKEAAVQATKQYNLQLERQLALEHGIFTINSKAGQYLQQFSGEALEYGQAEKGSPIYQDLENLSSSFNVSVEDLQKFFQDLSNSVFSQEQLGTLIGKPDLTQTEFDTFISRFNDSIERDEGVRKAFASGLDKIVKDTEGMAIRLEGFNAQFGNIISNLAPSVQNALSDLSVASLTSNFSYLNEVVYETGLSESSQEMFGAGIINAGKQGNTAVSKEPTTYINELIDEFEKEFAEGNSGKNFGEFVFNRLKSEGDTWEDLLSRMGVNQEKDSGSRHMNKFVFSEDVKVPADHLYQLFQSEWWEENGELFYSKLKASADQFYTIATSYSQDMATLGYDEVVLQEIQDKFAAYTSELDSKDVTRINEIVSQLETGNVENSEELIDELNSYYENFYQEIEEGYGKDLSEATKASFTSGSETKAKENLKKREALIDKLKKAASAFGFDFLTALTDFSLDQVNALREVLNILTEGITDKNTLYTIYSAVDSMIATQPDKADEIIAILGQYGPEATDAKGILKLNVALSNARINTTEVQKATRALMQAYIKTVPAIEDVTGTVSGWTKEINDLSKIISGLLSGGSIEDLSALLNSSFMVANPGLQAKLMSDIILDEKTGKYRIAPDSEVLGEITTALTGFYQDTVSILLEFIKQEMNMLIAEFGPQEQMKEEQKAMYASYETAYGLFKKFAESSTIAIQESIIKAQKEAIREQIQTWKEYIDALKDIDIFSNLDELLKSYENRLSNIKVEQDLNLSVQRGQDLLNEEVSTITKAMAAEQVKYNKALEESKTYATAIKESAYGTVDAQGRLIIKQGDLRELAEKIANASDDEKDSLQAEYDRIMDIADGYQEMQDILNETYANTLAYAAELRDIYKEELSYIVKVEERILQLLQERDDKALEAVKKRYDALKKADDDYISVVRSNIEKERQLRDQATQYDELGKKEKKLNLLIATSGGKKTATIIALEKEIAETRQTLADQAVDNLVTTLEDEAQKRAETYDNEVAYQEEILSIKKENMIAYNAEAKAIMSQNKNDIIATMKALDDEYIKGTTAAQETWVMEWEKNITDAKIAMFALTDQNSPLVKAYETINDMQNSTVAFTESLQQYTNELVGSIYTVAGAFDAAYSKAELLVSAYKSLIAEYEKLLKIGEPPFTPPEDTPIVEKDPLEEAYARYQKEMADLSYSEGTTFAEWVIADRDALFGADPDIPDYWLNYKAPVEYTPSPRVGKPDNQKAEEEEAAKRKARAEREAEEEAKRTAIVEAVTTAQKALDSARKALDNAQKASTDAAMAYIHSVQRDDPLMTQLRLKKIADDLIVTLPDKQIAVRRAIANLDHAKMALAEQESRGFIYKEGGLVNYTGPAWVDGTPAKPEAFLSSKDTSNIAALTNVLDNIVSIPSTRTASVPQSSGPITYQIEINVEELGEGYTVDNLYDDMEKKILDAASKGKVIQV